MILKYIISCILTVGILCAQQSVDISTFVDVTKCNKILKHKTHTTCFSYDKNGPIATWYQLDGKRVDEVNLKNRPKFKKDELLPEQHQVDYRLYTSNGLSLDMGHSAEDGSFDYDLDALNDVYYTSNITPQYHYLNAYYWSKAEQYSRWLAKTLGTVNVINIMLYGDDQFLRKQGYIPQAIPTEYIKILYNNEKEVIHCFKFKNSNEKLFHDKLIHHEIKCSKISLKHLLF